MCYSGSCAEKLISLFKSIQGCLKSIAYEFDISVPEMMIMLELYENKVLSLNELSGKIELPKSSVSRIVDQLVNRGYVSRKIPKENRRIVELSIPNQCLKCIDVACINDRVNDVVVGKLLPLKAKKMILAIDELNLILKGENE